MADCHFAKSIFPLHNATSSLTLVPRMAIYAIKHGDESNDRLQQRFKKQFQKSNVQKMLRDRKTRKKKPTKRLQRIRALKREQYRAENKKKQFYSNM
jgi:hypothetical protein